MSHQQVRKVLWTVVCVGIGLLIILQISGTYLAYEGVREIRATQQVGSPTQVKLLSIIEDIHHATNTIRDADQRIVDCTQPSGECYKAGRKRSADFSALLLVGVACAAGYQDLPDAARIEATNQCVSHWLSQHPQLSSQ
jgi:hypothetical protein